MVDEHRAWIACDWMLPITNDEERKLAYRTMGMIMVAVGRVVRFENADNIVAMFDKGTGRLVPYGPHVPERLISEFPESAFEESVPVISSEGLEEALEKATREAQSRLPEFVTAFQSRANGTMFAIKAKFTEGETVEWMWVQVEHIAGDAFEGRLDNDPNDIPRLKAGDRASIKPDEIADWIISDGISTRGGFSLEVFASQAARQ